MEKQHYLLQQAYSFGENYISSYEMKKNRNQRIIENILSLKIFIYIITMIYFVYIQVYNVYFVAELMSGFMIILGLIWYLKRRKKIINIFVENFRETLLWLNSQQATDDHQAESVIKEFQYKIKKIPTNKQ